jgi:hypothetical protein
MIASAHVFTIHKDMNKSGIARIDFTDNHISVLQKEYEKSDQQIGENQLH